MNFKNMPIRDKKYIAYDPDTPENILLILAKDDDEGVRRHVAYNRKAPINVLKTLTKDLSWVVRFNVVTHPDIFGKLLLMVLDYEKSLTKSTIPIIKAIYRNKKLPGLAKVVIETLYGELL